MALTPGFKKFAGLVLVTALVGGGIFAFKSGAFKSNASTAVQVEADVNQQAADTGMTIPQPINSPIAQAERVEEIVEQIAPTEAEAPPAPAPVHDVSSNRGLQNVLQSGQRK